MPRSHNLFKWCSLQPRFQGSLLPVLRRENLGTRLDSLFLSSHSHFLALQNICTSWTNKGPILIRIKAAAWWFNQPDNCLLPCKAVYWPYTVPRKIPWPFIRSSKHIRRLLASLLYNGQVSFPTLLPFSGTGEFSLSALSIPYAKFFPHNLSIKRYGVAFMRMWISLLLVISTELVQSTIHPAITDPPIIRTASKSPAKKIKSRYYGLSLMRTLSQGTYSVRYKGNGLYSVALGF